MGEFITRLVFILEIILSCIKEKPLLELKKYFLCFESLNLNFNIIKCTEYVSWCILVAPNFINLHDFRIYLIIGAI